MEKRVYVFCQLFYPELISSGQTVTELCEALAKKGLPLTIYCSQPTLTEQKTVKKTLSYQGMLIHRLWSTRFNKLSLIGKLLNHLSFGLSSFLTLLFLPKNSIILVFTNPPFLPILVRFLYPIKRFCYHVVIFDVYPETLIAAGLLTQSHLLSRWLSSQNKLTYHYAAHVIVIGRCMKKIIDTYFDHPHKNSTYIPMWSDDPNIQKPNNASFFKQQWSLQNHFVIGYAGNMAKFHPIETIMNAALLLKSSSDIAFVFVGEGAKKQSAQSFVTSHQLTNCQFHSYVDRDQLPNLLASFDCGLLGLVSDHTGLSVPSKTFGLLSSGVPTIACCSSESEISQLFTDYDCGIISDPNNAEELAQHILSLKNNNNLSQHYSKQAKKAINDRFNLNVISDQYFQILTQS